MKVGNERLFLDEDEKDILKKAERLLIDIGQLYAPYDKSVMSMNLDLTVTLLKNVLQIVEANEKYREKYDITKAFG